MSGNLAIVPNFVAASTPQGLRQQCLMVSIRIGHQVIFDPPIWVESEKKWFAWFREEFIPQTNIPKKSVLKKD